MKCRTLDDLMPISEDGPALRDSDFSRALAKWKADKLYNVYSDCVYIKTWTQSS